MSRRAFLRVVSMGRRMGLAALGGLGVLLVALALLWLDGYLGWIS